MSALEKNIRLLVIEDNPGDYVLIQEYLYEKVQSAELTHVSTLAEAENKLQQNLYDAVLLDLTLPDASGEEVVQRIVELIDDEPVIVLTGYENEEFGLKTLSLGVADYLLKDELTPFLLYKSISYSIERSRINRSLRKSEQQYRDLFDLSPLPKAIYDVKTLQFLDVNQTAIDHYGYSRKEFLSMTIKDIRPQEDISKLEQTLEKSLNAKGIYHSGISRHLKKNGDLIHVDVQSNMVEYNGQKAKMIVAHDITDRIKAERDLKRSEQKFKAVVQEGADLIAILDSDGNYKYVSPNHQQVTGWTPRQLEGRSARELVHPDDRERVYQAFVELPVDDRIQFAPFRFKNKEGEWFWFESIATNLTDDPSIQGYLVNTNDVTERKYYRDLDKLERDILEMNALEEKNYETIFWELALGIEQLHEGLKCSILQVRDGKLFNFATPNLPDGYVQALNGIPVGKNNGACGTAAYTKEMVITEDVLTDPRWEGFRELAEQFGFRACWSQPVLDNKKEVLATFAVYNKDPKRPSELELNTVKRAAHILRVLFESYQKEQAERQLALREQRFRSLVQDGSDLIAILDEEANYKFVGPSSAATLGIPAEEFIGKNALDYIHAEDRDRVESALRQLSEKERVEVAPFRFKNADGNWRWIETTVTNMLDNSAVEGIVANSRDVTERIEREQMLRESLTEKETLLLEIHHRVKNNLAVVSGMMQLQAFGEEDERVRQKLFESVSRIQTMGAIHEMLYQSESFSKLSLDNNVQQLVSTIVDTVQSAIDLDIEYHLDPIILNINQAIPCSLIVNEVVTNALQHAFNGRETGRIMIEISQNNDRIRLSIKDNGHGLPDDFENISIENSLGLKLIDTLATQLNGEYTYRSTDSGTQFTLAFQKAEVKGIGNVHLE